MNLDPLFSSGSALQHRLNQLTMTIVTKQDGEPVSTYDDPWVRWTIIGELMRDVFPNLERPTFSRARSNYDYALEEVICRLNMRFPNLERLAVGGRSIAEQTLGQILRLSQRLKFQRQDASKLKSVEDAMLKTMHRLKHIIVRTPLDGFELYEGLGQDEATVKYGPTACGRSRQDPG
ncbi:hypothetical protein BGZ97_007986 [Linnemannia gamsii]|uniref:Uncharacterized protein n=1 Tax=Linnemannia gamsii TaxID=64522 RepID=A0A9P6UW33_9FUNG|nr:hypothetical protein BGZ97_007986 [Linnemannia gamsii]